MKLEEFLPVGRTEEDTPKFPRVSETTSREMKGSAKVSHVIK